MAKKTKDSNLSLQERMEQALIPNWDEPYKLPENWCWVYLTKGFAHCLDSYRKPVNASQRSQMQGDIPYYGATGQVGWINDFLTNEHLVLLGEDGAPFLEYMKNKAYVIEGKAWVNNHAHILKSFYGKESNLYLMHYLNVFNYHGYVNGSTRLKLTQESMNTIPVPLAPIDEQKRIVNCIDSLFTKLDEAKEKAQEVVDGFETRKAAILHKAFSGELTAKWREENGISMTTWKHHNFSALCKIVRGGSPRPAGSPEFYGGDIPFMKVADITRITTPYVESTEHFIKPAGLKKTRMVKANTLLLTNSGATLGVPAICTFDTTFNDGIAAFLDLEPKSLLFYYYFWTMKTPELRAINKGAAQPNLNTDIIGAVDLDVPSLDEQLVIAKMLEKFISKEQQAKETAEAVIEQIDTMKKAILARAFRGELGTNDPDEESAVELLKSALSGNTNQQEPQKSNKKSTSIPNHIETALLTKLEKKIVGLFYTTESKVVSVDEIMSVSSKKIDIIDTLTKLEQRGILIRLNNSCYHIKE